MSEHPEREPRTEAGRTLVDWLVQARIPTFDGESYRSNFTMAVLAIEAATPSLWDIERTSYERGYAEGYDAGAYPALAATPETTPIECAICGDYTAQGVEVHESCLGSFRTVKPSATPEPALPDESWCDCDSEPVYGIKADRHLPSCRYGIVLDYLDIRDPLDYGDSTPMKHRSDTRGPCLACQHRAATPEPAVAVPDAAVVPEEPTSPLAWALRMVGAFTVKDDSENVCTMALGSINSVAERMDNWLALHPDMRAATPEPVLGCNCENGDGTTPARYHSEACPIRVAAPEPAPEPDALRYHPVTGDGDFAAMPLQDRLDTLADYYRSEGMRMAFRATTPEPALDECGHPESQHYWTCAICKHVPPYEAATPPAPALDVERLARATAAVVGWTGALDYHREWAAKVAREYAALTQQDAER